jgi:hypothetical protein
MAPVKFLRLLLRPFILRESLSFAHTGRRDISVCGDRDISVILLTFILHSFSFT